MMRIGAGIVTYNPDLKRLEQVADAILRQVSILWIVDNGSANRRDIERLFNGNESIETCYFEENRGIAAALNEICRMARSKNVLQVLTLDQDTVVEQSLVDALARFTGPDVGIVCPRVLYEDNEKYLPSPAKDVEFTKWAITSGSLTSIEAWEAVDGFDESMFIDGVDKDFCLRIGSEGYYIIRVNNAIIHHCLGELHCQILFGRTIYLTNHPKWRLYYMARNAIYICRKGLVGAIETSIALGKTFIKVSLLERKGLSKSATILRGIRDGFDMSLPEKVQNIDEGSQK